MNADKIIAYMLSKGYRVCDAPGYLNIVYVEGVGPDGTPNRDELDGWNDRSLLIQKGPEGWKIVFNTPATTEPGRQATFSAAAARRGGVARIAFGQHREAWRIGCHKGKEYHPALVQVAPVPVFRDRDRNGIRPGDKIETGRFGINQHGCPNTTPKNVGVWSEGCLVRQYWHMHLMFMDWLRIDIRVKANPDFLFDTTIIDGNDLHKFNFQPTVQ